MARKIKIESHLLKRLERKDEKRKKDFRQKRKYYLIVCEGEKTEPNYFEALKNDLSPGVLNVCSFKIEGTGHNTESLVEKALKLKSQWEEVTNRTIDRTWIVFDRDSFTPQSFNSAVQSCIPRSPEIQCAWSNEAFELWYLLHFHNYNTGISRARYKELIEQNLKPHLGQDFEYQKNRPDMYSILKKYGNSTQAINFAEALASQYNGRQDFADHNPCTLVFKLVRELFELEKELQVD